LFNMPTEDRETAPLSQELQELGFTDYEARIYIALLEQSPVTAYEISKTRGLPRPNVYGALEGLHRKDAVQKISEDPVRYVPVPPKRLLANIARGVNDRCARLRVKLEQAKTGQDVEPVWTFRATHDARAKIEDLIEGATRHVWVKAHCLELNEHLPSLREAARRGVDVLLVLFGSHEEIKRFEFPGAVVYPHEGGGTVVGLGRHLVTLTADFEQALVVNVEQGSGAYTQSGPIVNMADSLIRHEIYLAEIFNRLSQQLEREFGPALLSLRQKYLPREQAKALEAQLARGTNLPGST
jgi:sugar-specific transcriptional regulator TrmB